MIHNDQIIIFYYNYVCVMPVLYQLGDPVILYYKSIYRFILDCYSWQVMTDDYHYSAETVSYQKYDENNNH